MASSLLECFREIGIGQRNFTLQRGDDLYKYGLECYWQGQFEPLFVLESDGFKVRVNVFGGGDGGWGLLQKLMKGFYESADVGPMDNNTFDFGLQLSFDEPEMRDEYLERFRIPPPGDTDLMPGGYISSIPVEGFEEVQVTLTKSKWREIRENGVFMFLQFTKVGAASEIDFSCMRAHITKILGAFALNLEDGF